MKEIPFDDIRDIELNILKSVARYCDEHNLAYFLACGTALGAVRHHGFIPWDDDVDIAMPRPDYDRFVKEYRDGRYSVYSHMRDLQYPYAFAKVCDDETVLIEKIARPCELGVYIDVFPIDGLPNDSRERAAYLKKIKWDLRILSWKRISAEKKLDVPHKVIQTVAKAALSAVRVSSLVKKLDADVRKYPYEKAEYVGHLVSPSPWGRDEKPKAVFDSVVLHPFEDQQFALPGKYDEYLQIEYGDYMTLPPVEKRVARHDFLAYYKSGIEEHSN